MKEHSHLMGKKVYIVDGSRTPFLKVKGVGPWSAADLAVAAGKGLLNRQPFQPSDLDEVIIGAAMPEADEANIGRLVALRLGCGDQVTGYTVMRNCASGMQAIDEAALHIASGRSHLVLAGGTEAMSRAPLLFNHQMAAWLARWSSAKTITQRLKLMTQFKPAYLTPVVGLLRGLTDPLLGWSMGQTAEKLAYQFGLSRDDLDQYANESHHRAAHAYAQGHMNEIEPLVDAKGRVYKEDDGYRADSSLQGLGKLKPYFDKKYGMVTAGNSSQITDGACLLLLASAEAVERFNLPVLGCIVDVQWSGLDPSVMGLGPVHAAQAILQRQHLAIKDIDAWEINEAFAAQVLACFAAWNDETYCQTHLGESTAVGAPDPALVNQDGGAIAIGHPVGASGARIVLHLLHTLQRKQIQRGMAAICIGGGQGGAMYIERTTEVTK